jgi:hypothetical protein
MRIIFLINKTGVERNDKTKKENQRTNQKTKRLCKNKIHANDRTISSVILNYFSRILFLFFYVLLLADLL